MRLNLHKLVTPELEKYKKYCNFDEEEKLVFDLLSQKKSYVQIAHMISSSERTVYRISSRIREKIERFNSM